MEYIFIFSFQNFTNLQLPSLEEVKSFFTNSSPLQIYPQIAPKYLSSVSMKYINLKKKYACKEFLTRSKMSWHLPSALTPFSYVTLAKGFSPHCLSFPICNMGMTILAQTCKVFMRTIQTMKTHACQIFLKPIKPYKSGTYNMLPDISYK